MNLLLKLRAEAATDNACNILTRYSSTDTVNKVLKEARASAVRSKIDDKYIVNQSRNIIVTEIGYVTMALLPGYAFYSDELILIPGVDDKDQFGYLVLSEKFKPFHSLAQDADGAIADTRAAHARATALLDYYGDRESMNKAVQSAPWYQLSTIEDAINAGLCEWGTVSFLKRMKINLLSKHIGVPRFLVRFSGGFGNRVTASTIRRFEEGRANSAHPESSTKT